MESLRSEVAPLKAERLRLHRDINRLTFESAIAPDGDDGDGMRAALDKEKTDLAALETRVAPLQSQFDRLSRQFWVTKAQVVANKYDLSASRYRQTEQDEAYYEAPRVTMERLMELERVMSDEVKSLLEMVRSL